MQFMQLRYFMELSTDILFYEEIFDRAILTGFSKASLPMKSRSLIAKLIL